MRRSHLLVLLGFSLFLVTMSSCNPAPNFWDEAKAGQKKILVSFPPLYSITQAVAGENGYVLCLLTTRGPHEYEGAPTDLLKVNKADLFIYNGLTLDDRFADTMLRNNKNKSLAVLNIGAVLDKKHHDLLHHADGHEHAHDKKGDDKGMKEPAHDHKHGDFDPHIWLGPDQVMAMTRIIADKLSDTDPANKKGYETRAAKFIDEIKKLEEYGKAAFKDKKNKKIITMHEAFDYFADAFDIKIAETIQGMPGTDPDHASFAKLVKLCTDEKITVIAVEPQYPKGQAEALQASLKKKGLAVQIISLDPLETAPLADGAKHNPDPAYYLKKMRENIDTLAKALQ